MRVAALLLLVGALLWLGLVAYVVVWLVRLFDLVPAAVIVALVALASVWRALSRGLEVWRERH